MSFPEKTIAQAEALLKIQVRIGVRKPSFQLMMLSQSPFVTEQTWSAAWRNFAIEYLTAKAEGTKIRDTFAEQEADFWGEIAGKRGEDDPRPTH